MKTLAFFLPEHLIASAMETMRPSMSQGKRTFIGTFKFKTITWDTYRCDADYGTQVMCHLKFDAETEQGKADLADAIDRLTKAEIAYLQQ